MPEVFYLFLQLHVLINLFL